MENENTFSDSESFLLLLWSALIEGKANQKFFCIFPLTKGKELLTLTGHNAEVYSAAYSPDGQRIVTAGYGDKTAKVWEAQIGTELFTLTGLNDQVMSDTYSPDGKRIASVGEVAVN